MQSNSSSRFSATAVPYARKAEFGAGCGCRQKPVLPATVRGLPTPAARGLPALVGDNARSIPARCEVRGLRTAPCGSGFADRRPGCVPGHVGRDCPENDCRRPSGDRAETRMECAAICGDWPEAPNSHQSEKRNSSPHRPGACSRLFLPNDRLDRWELLCCNGLLREQQTGALVKIAPARS
jgi:hypothetical protein